MSLLLLAGSDEFLPAMRAIDEEALRHTPGTPPRVAILPTAAGQEGTVPFDWIALGERHFTALGCVAFGVPILDRAGAMAPDHVAAIASADFVYLSGGDPLWLIASLRDTPAWTAIGAVLAHGGTLAGSSAGAMAIVEKTPRPRSAPAVWHPALGLVPGIGVLPHYDRFGASRIGPLLASAPPDLTILGIDEQTVLFCHASETTVLGAGAVTLWQSGRATVFRAGERLPPGVVRLAREHQPASDAKQ